MIKKFNGINHLAYFSNVSNKKILLCGEYHDKTGDSIPCYQRDQ